MSTALQVDTNLTYCPTTLTVNQALSITNVSNDELVYKIKTNKKNFLSMNPCNGFIKPYTNLAIPVKIVEHVPQNVSIKLQVDWSIVTPQIRQKNDIKIATVNEKDIFKKVFPIIRKQSETTKNQSKPSIKTSLASDSQKQQKNQSKITPFEYEKKQVEEDQNESAKLYSSFKQESPLKQEQAVPDNVQQYRSVNQKLDALSTSTKNLEIVSEEDEEDHEKELEQIRNEQVVQRRLIDEYESKIRRIKNEINSAEVIDLKLLVLGLAGSFLVGQLVQYLIF